MQSFSLLAVVSQLESSPVMIYVYPVLSLVLKILWFTKGRALKRNYVSCTVADIVRN